MKKLIYLLMICLFPAYHSYANNIQITNVSIVNNGPGNIQVKFDLSWDNSWRVNVGPSNYDGVWVFFKYKQPGGDWKHITMTGSNNVIPANFDVYQTTDFLKAGAMIYREPTNLGIGSVSVVNIKLGVINTLPYDIDLKGFAIEMVFIPAPTLTRTFFGDGDGVSESFNAFHYTDNTATNTSVLPMKCDANSYDDAELETDGMYIYSNDTIQTTNPLGSLDPFPTMKAIWCMKYEITQAAYRDFLNTLSYDQQDTRSLNAPNSAIGTGALTTSGTNRNYIEIKTSGIANTTPAVYGCDASGNNVYDEAADGEWLACGFLTWPDVAAFLDWSGLAPMSEFQFERICRGNTSAGSQPAILGEYAWGTNTIFNSAYTLSTPFTSSETASNASPSLGNGSCFNNSPSGPMRSGIFATGSSNRVTSGASFYGVMEMSGNVMEYVISVGTVAGRSCRNLPNGNGTISSLGNAQLPIPPVPPYDLNDGGAWPGLEGNNSSGVTNTCSGACEVTASAGIVTKGGSYAHSPFSLALAYRGYSTPTTRLNYYGGRGVLYIK